MRLPSSPQAHHARQHYNVFMVTTPAPTGRAKSVGQVVREPARALRASGRSAARPGGRRQRVHHRQRLRDRARRRRPCAGNRDALTPAQIHARRSRHLLQVLKLMEQEPDVRLRPPTSAINHRSASGYGARRPRPCIEECLLG